MKSLRLKIILTYTIMSIIILVFMRLFHGSYVLYDMTYFFRGLNSFLPIVFTIMAVAAVYILKVGAPLDKAWNNSKNRNEDITEKERETSLKIISKVPGIIVCINLLGFFVGPTVSIFVKLNGAPFFTPQNILTVLYNIGLGMVGALFEIKLVDLFLTKPRESFNLFFIEDNKKVGRSNATTLMAVAASFYLISVMFISAIMGYLYNGIDKVTTGDFFIKIILLGIFLFILLLPILFVYTNYVTSMALLITKKLDYITSGDGDLSKRMSIIKFDEFGLLTAAINNYMDNLKSLLVKIHETHGKVSSASVNMFDISQRIGESLKGVSQKSRRVEEASISQLDLVNSADNSITQVVGSISKVTDSVKVQSRFVSTSSAAIEEMVSNISSVSTIAEKANEQSEALKHVSLKGEEAVANTSKAFKEVQDSSEEMKAIVSLISKVAAQTNLLAMNAAIEAAHAGEAGKGFAVVADEVRTLAEDSGNSIKRIIDLIKIMNTKIERGVVLSKDAEVAFNRISKDVSSTTELIRTISSAMNEQRQGADDILNSISSLVEATNGIENLSNSQRADSKEIEKSIHRLKDHTIKITGEVENQNSSFEEINSLSDSILDLSKDNSLAVEELQDSISKFRF